jgi:DNA invertase Pin-like site-specific DNA recombinase
LPRSRQKAGELGYAVADDYTYTDAFNGEELFERPALSRLRADAKARRFCLVLAYNTYALAKEPAHMAILHDEWERAGIRFDFVTESFDDSIIGQIVLQLNDFSAKKEGERRKDRFERARRARAESGKAVVAHRANYGYQWADVRLKDGRLSRERLEADPVTGPVVVRMYELMATGHTMRSIAALFTREGIPTPTGKTCVWDQSSIRMLLINPLYCGRPMTMRSKSIPVEKSVRHLYARRTRDVPRPFEEQVALAAPYAPALVSPALWESVVARLRLNQQLAYRNNRQPAATLARGLVQCGYCGFRVQTVNTTSHGADYRCQTALTRMPRSQRCRSGGQVIVAHKLDAAVWASVSQLLRSPALIEQEVARMAEMEDPGAELLATLDRQMAELDRRIANKRKFAELVDDNDERAELAAEVTQLRQSRRVLEAERRAAEARTAGWGDQQRGLQRTLDWCARVAGNLETFTDTEKRETLLALGADVVLYRAGHTPRAERVLHLPLSGGLALSLDGHGTSRREVRLW